ncbi:MAG: right-handed parallel beta-helix repeat-containing protein, partial [Acidobacteriota bacterium]
LLATPAAAGTLETLTLPAPSSPGGGLWFSDVQDRFPDVDWSTLDRLYLPAGEWSNLLLGNLPMRSPDRPLVITNQGGQVRIGRFGGNSHPILIFGGSNWRLTGHYDPVAQTGHENFPGHAGGYANSRGRYGIFVDDAFETAGSSGISVAGRATDFEIDFVEITRANFAGVLMKTDDQGDADMSNVRFHDNYVHDIGSEGLYFGSTQSPPQHKFPGLKIYNNRIVRTGTEIAQFGQVGRGSEIYNNVFVMGALTWKKPFQNFQDNAGQLGVRQGTTSIHHNIFIGGAASFFQLFPQPRDGDSHAAGDQVIIHDNYFSHSRNFGAYLHAQSDGVTEYILRDNWLREVRFEYDELDPDANNRNAMFITFNSQSQITFEGNRWTGPQTLVASGGGANITETGSVNLPSIDPVRFMDSGFPADFDYLKVESWTDFDKNGQPVTYRVGDYAVTLERENGGDLYRCLVANTGQPPATSPSFWQPVPPPADDYRLHPGSPFQGFGLLDDAGTVLFDDFESGGTEAWSSTVP